MALKSYVRMSQGTTATVEQDTLPLLLTSVNHIPFFKYSGSEYDMGNSTKWCIKYYTGVTNLHIHCQKVSEISKPCCRRIGLEQV